MKQYVVAWYRFYGGLYIKGLKITDAYTVVLRETA